MCVGVASGRIRILVEEGQFFFLKINYKIKTNVNYYLKRINLTYYLFFHTSSLNLISITTLGSIQNKTKEILSKDLLIDLLNLF